MTRACLNCGATLDGPYCAQCGQRDVPAYPTLREYAGDAWEEMSGWDGRFARTLVTLFRHPGMLTIQTLEGRRASYVKPLRLYLSASLLYFLIAAAAPNVATTTKAVIPGDRQITIDIRDPRGMDALTPEQRAQAIANIDRAPAVLQPLFRAVVEDPAGFRNRVLTAYPKVVFAMVPVFAAIAGLFYRRRRYMHHLTFALHLHAMVFLALTATELVQFTRNAGAVQITGVAAMLFLVWYIVRALRVTYGGGLLGTLAKSFGIAVLYVIVWTPVMAAVLAWAVLFR